jgi:hypothetical protein
MFKAGDKVGMRRWPYSHGHPDTWEQPHKGIVLDIKDQRAWKTKSGKTFPYTDAHGCNLSAGRMTATKEEINFAYQRLVLQGDLDPNKEVPVLWSFGYVYWEKIEKLLPYKEDYEAWATALARAYRNEKPARQKNN